MPGSPKVSIVMPVFNGGDYFEIALRSATGQTYKNLEIIVVDDGSEDEGRTERVCRAQMKITGIDIIYIRQENAGAGAALNTGIGAMRGDIFCWLSHDDIFYSEKVERQVSYWSKLNRAGAILISDYDIVDGDGRVRNTVKLDHSAAVSSPRLPLFGGWINGCTIFAPAEILSGSSTFETRYRYVQDYRLWLKLVRDHEIFHQPEVLVAYRVHAGQDSHKPEALKEGDDFWIDAITELSAVERSQLFGSTWRFFDASWRYLQGASYAEAAAVALGEREASLADTLVSVILPVTADEEAVRRSLASVLGQSHGNLEIILVDQALDPAPGSRAGSDPRIRRISQTATGLGKALNAGLSAARGEYACLLLAGDEFLSEKIERQVETLQLSGAVFGYTSFYSRSRPEEEPRSIGAGRLSGIVDPKDLAGHPLSTMMAHRLLLAEGFTFSEDGDPTEGWPSADLATRRPVFGLDDPLVVVGARGDTPTHGGEASPIALRQRRKFDPDTHMSIHRRRAFEADHKLLLDLSAPANHYIRPPRRTLASFEVASGLIPWEYVASVVLSNQSSAEAYLQLTLQDVREELYVLLVDDAFNAVGERLAVAPHKCMHDLWFKLPGEAFAVVIQAGAAPAAATFKIAEAAIYWNAAEPAKPGR